jgi:hypothetical protein
MQRSATDRSHLNHHATPRLHKSKVVLHIDVNAVNQDLSKSADDFLKFSDEAKTTMKKHL